MNLLFILVFSILSPVLSEQWIDPYDMNTSSKKNLKKSSSTGDLEAYGEVHNCPCDKKTVGENNSLVYLKRLVNILIKSANVENDASGYNGKLHFTLDEKSFQFLQEFSENRQVNIDQLRKLDTIVSEMFYESSFDYYCISFASFQEKVFTLLFSKNSLPLVGLSVFVYIAYNLFRSNFSIWYVFRYFMFIVVLVDFVQRYQQLHEEAEEHNMKLEYSAKCDTSKMSWTKWLKFMTSHENCEKKFVSLLEVGLLQVKSLIIVPLSAAGTGMGQFGAELWKHLPFPWNILIFPIMLIFCVFIAIIIMTTINGTPFKVNLMHLLHFEYGEKKNSGAGVMLEKLLDTVSRPMIENVKERRNKKSPAKEKSRSEVIDNKKDFPPRKKSKELCNNSGDNSNETADKEIYYSVENNSEKESASDIQIINGTKNNSQKSKNNVNVVSSGENSFELASEKHASN